LLLTLATAFAPGEAFAQAAEPVRIATFAIDATPPLGTPLAYMPAERIVDRLTARGIVILAQGDPIVLCAVDWIGISNAGHDAWRVALAQAAGTTPDRVSVHTLHQHDAPRCDYTAEALMEEHGLAGRMFDVAFSRRTIEQAAAALRKSLESPRRVTHLGLGQAKVEKVASNRRVLGPDGKVKYVRFSSCRIPEAIAAPEGVIDPWVRTVSFWDEQRPLVSLSYYATHPQSYYGDGDVSADFVGLARARRDAELPEVVHIHFNGAGGNVAAGKYNDGSKEVRPVLTERLHTGMESAWADVKRQPITAADVQWRSTRVALPVRDTLDEDQLQSQLANEQNSFKQRLGAALNLAWVQRCRAGHKIEVSCLRLGNAYLVHMPGELFVEYQLAAAKMKPEGVVCMAAYADYGPGYIGTEISYGQGGYETGPASRTAPEVENVLLEALGEVLK
jgi:hypothetical protein